MIRSTPTEPAMHPAPMPPRRTHATQPLSALRFSRIEVVDDRRMPINDGALVRQALDLHREAGELPRGIPARLAAMLGVNRATVSRASSGSNVQLSPAARQALEAHVADSAAHPLPPGSELRGRPRADAPPLDPDRRKSRGGGRGGCRPREGTRTAFVWLTEAEEEAVRDLAARRGVVPGRLVAEALESYAQSPDKAPPKKPETARKIAWMTGAEPIAALDAATGGARGRPEHVRAAVLRALEAAKKKNR